MIAKWLLFFFAILTDLTEQEAEEELKVKCPCGNDEVSVICKGTTGISTISSNTIPNFCISAFFNRN